MAYQYLILDSRGNAVAHGTSDYDPKGAKWRMVVDDGDLEEIAKHTNLRLVGNSDAVPALEARIVQRKGNLLVLEPLRTLGKDLRQNLRIPVCFASYIYPISGEWTGREPIVSENLSCGGLAFSCSRVLEVGEQVEVVIPITAQPLLLKLKILRCSPGEGGRSVYAGQFVAPLREAESMVRETVFSLQLQESQYGA